MDTRKLFLWADIALIVAIVISAVFLGLAMSQGPATSPVPTKVQYTVEHVSRTEAIVVFGNFSGTIGFTEVVITVTSPNGDISKADVRNNTLAYPQSTSLHSLSAITVSSTGPLMKGESFSIDNYKNLQIGVWTFKMAHRNTGQVIMEGTIVIPDPSIIPQGAFSSIQRISPQEVELIFGTISPTVDYSSCYLEVSPPDQDLFTMRLNGASSLSIYIGNATTVVVVDINKDGIINVGDHIDIVTQNAEIGTGRWSVVLKYVYEDPLTDNTIANAIFDIN